MKRLGTRMQPPEPLTYLPHSLEAVESQRRALQATLERLVQKPKYQSMEILHVFFQVSVRTVSSALLVQVAHTAICEHSTSTYTCASSSKMMDINNYHIYIKIEKNSSDAIRRFELHPSLCRVRIFSSILHFHFQLVLCRSLLYKYYPYYPQKQK